MKIHELKRKTQNKGTMIVGRGGRRGKTSGRGGKGQTARAGHKMRPEMRDVIKKMPKLRGYAFNTRNEKARALNVGDLEVIFANNDSVTPKTLVQKGAISLFGGKYPKVKILSLGELTKKLEVSGCAVSGLAKTKIEKAGGKVL